MTTIHNRLTPQEQQLLIKLRDSAARSHRILCKRQRARKKRNSLKGFRKKNLKMNKR